MPTGSSPKWERQYEHIKEARQRNVQGRSSMTKAQLEKALAR